MDQETLNERDKLDACARAAHEVNRAYCLALGDNSQPAWTSPPRGRQISALEGVDGVLAGNGPEQSHESWLKQKAETGWKYGPVKDPEKKEHPCFVPYAELPDSQKAKDRLFVTTVRCMAASLGLAVHYPARPASPELPAGLIDWSKTTPDVTGIKAAAEVLA